MLRIICTHRAFLVIVHVQVVRNSVHRGQSQGHLSVHARTTLICCVAGNFASSMAKSALNSSIPPTFHLGSSGGPVGAERRALVACTLPRFAAVALCCRPPLISPCFDVRWSLRRGGRGPRQAAAPEEADPARRAVLFGQAVQHHAAGVEPGAGQRVQRGGD